MPPLALGRGGRDASGTRSGSCAVVARSGPRPRLGREAHRSPRSEAPDSGRGRPNPARIPSLYAFRSEVVVPEVVSYEDVPGPSHSHVAPRATRAGALPSPPRGPLATLASLLAFPVVACCTAVLHVFAPWMLILPVSFAGLELPFATGAALLLPRALACLAAEACHRLAHRPTAPTEPAWAPESPQAPAWPPDVAELTQRGVPLWQVLRGRPVPGGAFDGADTPPGAWASTSDAAATVDDAVFAPPPTPASAAPVSWARVVCLAFCTAGEVLGATGLLGVAAFRAARMSDTDVTALASTAAAAAVAGVPGGAAVAAGSAAAVLLSQHSVEYLRSPALAAHGPFLPAAMACLVLGALSLSIGPLLALRGRLGTVAAWGALAWRQGHEGGSRGLRESLLGSQDSDSDDPSSQRGAGQTGQGGDAGSRHSAVAAAMLITAALVGVAAAASTGAAAAVLVPAAALGALSALRWRVAGRLRRSAARLAASTGAPSSMRTGAELRAAGVLAAVLAAVAAAPLDAAVFGQAPWATWVAHSYWRELLLREKSLVVACAACLYSAMISGSDWLLTRTDGPAAALSRRRLWPGAFAVLAAGGALWWSLPVELLAASAEARGVLWGSAALMAFGMAKALATRRHRKARVSL